MKRLILLLFFLISFSKCYAVSVLHWGSRPFYSPDGNKIVFAAEMGRENRTYGESQIYVMNRDGSNIKRLSPYGRNEQLPIYSPDGSIIAFVSQKSEFEAREIWIMNADGSNRQPLTNNQFDDSCPSFSPDGNRIVFTRASVYRQRAWGDWTWGSWNIYIMNVDGAEERKITNENVYAFICPYFSPDGSSLLVDVTMSLKDRNFQSKYPDGTICVVDINKGLFVPIGENDTGYPSFSPDASKIVYQGRPYHREIFIMDSDGSNKRQITKEQRYNAHPIFSPDGTKILFLSDPGRDDDWGLYEVNVDGSNLHKIPVNLDDVK